MSAEALLATGYAAFLMLAATPLDLLARHSHRRSARYRTRASDSVGTSTSGNARRVSTYGG